MGAASGFFGNQENISFAPAMTRTNPSACRSRCAGSRDRPSWVPTSAPMTTAPTKYGSSGGSCPTLVRFPARPAIETHRMKPADMPDVFRTASHPKNRISGLRKMPPPVPVRPDSAPIPAPPKPSSSDAALWIRLKRQFCGATASEPPRSITPSRQAACSNRRESQNRPR